MHTFPVGRRAAGALATLTAILLAAGCGGSEHGTDHNSQSAPSTTATSTTGAQHNQADVTFAQDMIPHHQQAVDMATIATQKAHAPAVKSLAEKIQQAQQPEIDQLTGWLADWGQPTPTMPSPGEHSGHGMPGMMTDTQMAELHKASGTAFDQMFLHMMIGHHEGAVEMAKTEQQDGLNAEAKSLAVKIEKDQTAEIDQMKQLLSGK